jgi:hypothetical protein
VFFGGDTYCAIKCVVKMKQAISLIFIFISGLGNSLSGSIIHTDFDAELISYETSITIERGRLQTLRTFEIQINNRAGEEYTSIVIPFSPMKRISGIEAYIKDARGTVVKKLRQNEIQERSAYSSVSFYADEKEKLFTLKHNVYPYTLVYSYQITQREFFYIDYWFPVLDLEIPTRKAVLNIEVPHGYPIKYKEQFIDGFDEIKSDTKVTYRWEASYNGKLRDEILPPFISHFLPAVYVVPEDFVYDSPGSFKSWVDFGNWQFQLLKEASDLPKAEKAKIDRHIIGVDNDMEKVEILYRMLQKVTRYVSINIETGGLKPYPASYVAQNKFGDCKALTNYFKTVLEHVGIPAYYTLIYANKVIRPIDKSFPSSQFNHVILCVPLNNDTLWLDCTSKGAFNYPGIFNQNREALLIDSDRSHFVKVPAMAEKDVLEERFAMFSPFNESQTNLECRITYRGYNFELLQQIQSLPVNRQEQILRRDFSLQGLDRSAITMGEPDMNLNLVEIKHIGLSTQVYSKYGNNTYIRLMPFSLPKLSDSEDRVLPVQINYPIAKNDFLVYAIPEGFEMIHFPEKREIITDFGRYVIDFEKNDRTMIIKKELRINSGTYIEKQYDDLHAFLDNISLIEKELLILTQKSENP